MAIQNERIRQRILDLGMSISAVSEITHIPKSTLHRYVTGQRENIPLPVIEALAEVLMVSPSYLMGWEDLSQGAHRSLFLSRYLSALGYPFESSANDEGDWIRDKKNNKSYLVNHQTVSIFERTVESFILYQINEMIQNAERVEDTLNCWEL